MSNIVLITSILCCIYLALFFLIYLNQEKLIFFPPGPNTILYREWSNIEFTINSGNEKLQCWKVINQDCENDYSLVYFGGNAEDVSGNLPDANQYNVKTIYFINLSGYGNSTGKPSERAFYTNGLDVYDYIVSQEKTKPESLLLMGRSLGSAVALYVNANRSAKALMLVTPFDRLSNLVPLLIKSFFPTSLTLKHKFDNLKYLELIKNKILILAASHDEVIPAKLTMRLHEQCNGKAQCTVINDTNHQTISNQTYFNEINTFINSL